MSRPFFNTCTTKHRSARSPFSILHANTQFFFFFQPLTPSNVRSTLPVEINTTFTVSLQMQNMCRPSRESCDNEMMNRQKKNESIVYVDECPCVLVCGCVCVFLVLVLVLVQFACVCIVSPPLQNKKKTQNSSHHFKKTLTW